MRDRSRGWGIAEGGGPALMGAWFVLAMLLVSACCGPCFPQVGPVQDDGTAVIEPTAEPEPTREARCCRWNHSVVNGGGGQTALAVNPVSPNVVYVTTDHGGIAKSVDYGNNWQTINNNIGGTRLADVKLDPLNPDVLYVTAALSLASGEGELYRSLDGGAHWEFLTDAFGTEKWPSSREIVIIPQDVDGDSISDVIYVGAWAGSEGGERGGIWKSGDEGATWQQIGRAVGDGVPLERANVWVLRSDPSDPDVLYAGMFVYDVVDSPGGIFKTTDGGQNWTDITNNIPVRRISDIAISPDGNVLYVATNTFYESEQGAGIYKSIDGGETWTPVNRGLGKTSLKFEVLLMDKDDPDVLYAGPFRGRAKGIYKTTDGGRRWYRTKFDQGDWWAEHFANAWALAQGADSKLYAGTWSGVYRSDDGGESWKAYVQGLGNVEVNAVALDPRNPDVVYLGLSDVGPWKSIDGGHTWSRIQDGYYEPYGVGAGSVGAFAISPSDPDVIYSAVLGSSGSTLMGVNKTVNGGRTWTAVNRGLPDPDPAWVATDIVVHPRTPDVAYVGIKSESGAGGVFKTDDGGRSWTELPHVAPEGDWPRVESLAISASDPDVVVVGTRQPGRVYRTVDGGESWSLVSPPPNLMNSDTIVHDVDVHPLCPECIVIGVNVQGAYKTMDGGQTWTKVLDAGFFRDNVGDMALNPQAQIHATIAAIKFDPDDPRIIYAGHNNRGRGGFGVAKSTDGGAWWTLIDGPGFQHRNVFTIDLNPRTKELFVGGFDGLYIYELFF